jgi:hypothetical protein
MTEELLSQTDSFQAFIHCKQAVINEEPLNLEEYQKYKTLRFLICLFDDHILSKLYARNDFVYSLGSMCLY